jgi:hypothetical protein
MVASKELIKFPDDPVSMDQVELPEKLSKVRRNSYIHVQL